MDSPLTVYIDFKSPYAYLALEPTRRMGRELGIQINWLPFVLDIPSYLGSAQLGKSGEVAEQSRSQNQWSGVKYAYYDCRRYANLRDMTIRGTVKIWDTNLAAVGMLWARQQGDDILQRYIDGVYGPFWKRELDVEDPLVIEHVLLDCGADVNGFAAFTLGEGAALNKRLQEQAFDQGIFGVPTYVLGETFYFGREHLPHIRWQLAGRHGTAPDIAYEVYPEDNIAPASSDELSMGINPHDPESYLALETVLAMSRELDVALQVYLLPPRKPGQRADPDDGSRGARHRRFRTANRACDRQRYLPAGLAGKDLATHTLAWLQRHAIQPDAAGPAIAMPAGGYVNSPVFSLGEETFVGRQHLPLIRARLERARASASG